MGAITTVLVIIYFSLGSSKKISSRSIVDNDVETIQERWVTVKATKNDIHVSIGETVELECEASGLGQPQIKFISSINAFTDDGQVFAYDVPEHSSTALVKTNAKLHLIPEESQIVYCEATSGNQIARDEVKITVSKARYLTNKVWSYRSAFEAPRIVFFDVMYLDEMGKDAVLPCRVENYGESKVIWLNSMKEVLDEATDDRYVITSNGDLMIRNIEWNDMGAYTCVASNKHGEDNITTFLYPMVSSIIIRIIN